MRIFMAPRQYIQGPGAITRLGGIAAAASARPVLLMDAGMAPAMEPGILADLHANGLDALVLRFGGEITHAALDALEAQAAQHAPDLVIGVGGGKALDAAKGLALRLALDTITVPTIASTDAPASRGLVLYKEDHSPAGVQQLPHNPLCVLVDTGWIARAPVRFMRAGIGDAISKKFEVEACAAAGGLNKHGERASLTALAMANACYAALRAHGVGAVQAVARGVPDEALESVVEACVLMSALAFENGGLSLAHAMTAGLTRARSVSARLHGEHVAYGLLVQLALEGCPDAVLDDIAAFYREIGLPDSLEAMGMTTPADAELREIARINAESPRKRNSLATVTQATVLDAMRRIESLAAA